MGFRRFMGLQTRPEKAAELDQMSATLHRRISYSPDHLVRVTYDSATERFVVTDRARKSQDFATRKETEQHLSKHYRAVREHLDEGCHH